tara:strand:+ start:509 stop:661 length:153 start_codon:yes stop_codon:yes gene_type:complete
VGNSIWDSFETHKNNYKIISNGDEFVKKYKDLKVLRGRRKTLRNRREENK